MAREFVVASSEALESTTIPVSAPPFSMGCWFNTPTGNSPLMTLADNSVSDHYFELNALVTVSNLVRTQINDGTGNTGTNATGAFDINTWTHALATYTSTTLRHIYRDGGNEGISTFDRTPAGLDRFAIGARLGSSPAYANARIAEAAVWSVVLKEKSRLMLGAGYSPLFVEPESLLYYCRIPGRTDPEIDLIGGNHLTVTGTPLAYPHPRILYPSAQILQFPSAISTTVFVTDVNTTEEWADGDTGVPITGTGFV